MEKDPVRHLQISKPGGLNLKLPDPHFKKGRDKSKMSLYEEASKDSAILKEKMKTDPYYLRENQGPELSDSIHLNLHDFLKHDAGNKDLHGLSTETPDENEAKIMDKLAKLKEVIRQKTEDPPARSLTVPSNQKNEQLEKLMSNLNGSHVHDERMDHSQRNFLTRHLPYSIRKLFRTVLTGWLPKINNLYFR